MTIIILIPCAGIIVGLVKLAHIASKMYAVHKICKTDHLTEKQTLYITKMMQHEDN